MKWFYHNIIKNGLRNILILIVRFYRKFISPLKPPTCIYTPTCSQYAMEALKVHGAIKGSYLSIRRILRCHPWGRGGHDPVPIKEEH